MKKSKTHRPLLVDQRPFDDGGSQVMRKPKDTKIVYVYKHAIDRRSKVNLKGKTDEKLNFDG